MLGRIAQTGLVALLVGICIALSTIGLAQSGHAGEAWSLSPVGPWMGILGGAVAIAGILHPKLRAW